MGMTMHYYIKNGKSFASEHPIYYFEWVYGNGQTTFGMHGTETEYSEDADSDPCPDRKLVRQVPVSESLPPF
jgi:hypothetical protein